MSIIAEALEKLAEREMTDIEREWDKYNAPGKANINFMITKDTDTIVKGTYNASGMKMWLLEYGQGTQMDTSNPLLERYEMSDVYNSKRGHAPYSMGHEIRTRPKDGYDDLDGVHHAGSGLGISKNYEYGLNVEWFGGKREIKLVWPHHIIKDIIPRKDTVHKQMFKQDILSALRDIMKGAMNG